MSTGEQYKPGNAYPLMHARFSLMHLAREGTAGTRVSMSGVQGEPFGKYTPQASLSMLIINPVVEEALHTLKPGQHLDVLFIPVEDEAQPAAQEHRTFGRAAQASYVVHDPHHPAGS